MAFLEAPDRQLDNKKGPHKGNGRACKGNRWARKGNRGPRNRNRAPFTIRTEMITNENLEILLRFRIS